MMPGETLSSSLDMTLVGKIAVLSNQLDCQSRIKLKHDDNPEPWSSSGIGLPVNGYIELNGPWPFREVEWLEINPVVIQIMGRLIAPKQLNYLERIVSLLQVEAVRYSIVDGMVRIPFEALIN